jgi:ribosomal protein S6
LERPAMLELERVLKLSEDVLRYLLVRIDENE